MGQQTKRQKLSGPKNLHQLSSEDSELPLVICALGVSAENGQMTPRGTLSVVAVKECVLRDVHVSL